MPMWFEGAEKEPVGPVYGEIRLVTRWAMLDGKFLDFGSHPSAGKPSTTESEKGSEQSVYRGHSPSTFNQSQSGKGIHDDTSTHS